MNLRNHSLQIEVRHQICMFSFFSFSFFIFYLIQFLIWRLFYLKEHQCVYWSTHPRYHIVTCTERYRGQFFHTNRSNLPLYLKWKMQNSSLEKNQSAIGVLRMSLASRSSAEIVIETSSLIFINVLALSGNTMVVIAFLWKPRLRNITNTFIIALSMSDIMMALFPMPMSVGALMLGEWHFGDAACAVQGFMVNFLAFVSLLIMALTAVNRFYKIKKPLKCNVIFTYRNTVIMLLSACFVSLAVSISYVFTSERTALHPGKIICVPLNPSKLHSLIYTIISGLMFVILPAVVIVFCYFKVFQKLRQHNQRLNYNIGQVQEQQPDTTANRRESQLSRLEFMISRTLFGTVLGFFICWIPCFGIDITDIMMHTYLNRRVYLVYMYLAYTSSAINPLIYGILNPSFRREFFHVIFCRRKTDTSIENQDS